jgi:hypothetical protein
VIRRPRCPILPIPYNQLQSLVASEDDPSFGDLYEFDFPSHFIIQLGEYFNYNLSVPGVGIGGKEVMDSTGEIKIEAGRVRGTIEMPAMEVLSRQLSFTATIDAELMTPTTRIRGPADPVKPSADPTLAGLPVPMPEGAEDFSRSGSNLRQVYHAVVAKPIGEVLSYYHTELRAAGWKEVMDDQDETHLQYKNAASEVAVNVERKGSTTDVEVILHDVALAKEQGVYPPPGKGRIVLANAHNVEVVFTIGTTDYPMKAGRGGKDIKQALNYAVGPGKYSVVIKVPGQPPKTEQVNITEGSTWAIIALPTGGYLPMRMY